MFPRSTTTRADYEDVGVVGRHQPRPPPRVVGVDEGQFPVPPLQPGHAVVVRVKAEQGPPGFRYRRRPDDARRAAKCCLSRGLRQPDGEARCVAIAVDKCDGTDVCFGVEADAGSEPGEPTRVLYPDDLVPTDGVPTSAVMARWRASRRRSRLQKFQSSTTLEAAVTVANATSHISSVQGTSRSTYAGSSWRPPYSRSIHSSLDSRTAGSSRASSRAKVVFPAPTSPHMRWISGSPGIKQAWLQPGANHWLFGERPARTAPGNPLTERGPRSADHRVSEQLVEPNRPSATSHPMAGSRRARHGYHHPGDGKVVTAVGAVAATGNYATPPANNPLGQTRLVPAGRVGSTVEIKGVAGAKAAVTLLKVVDPARAAGQLITEASG